MYNMRSNMARKTKSEAEVTRARILASALALFVKNGYERTTFNDIAARLSMTKGAVYWHFASKEKLMVAIVDELLERFARDLEARIPRDELTFRGVSEAMVENAVRIATSARERSCYLFMKTRVKWGGASMKGVREEIIAHRRFGPIHAYEAAISNDIRSGLVRPDVDAFETAMMCQAIWDGLVQSHIDKFLGRDLATVLRNAFAAVWNSISTKKKESQDGSKEQ